MYRNASDLNDGEVLRDFDLCVVGAGAAGIAIAQRLIASSKRVLVLASGLSTDVGKPSGNREVLYQGTVGSFLQRIDPIFLTRSRLRMYGGTTNHFGFWAAPLTEADLVSRPGYREAAWPFGREELDRYYPDANAFGDYGPFNYEDIPFWERALGGKTFPAMPGDQIMNAIFHAQYTESIKDFQLQFGPALEAAENVTVLFNANVLQVWTDQNRRRVEKLVCATIENGQRGKEFEVALEEGGRYVLAQGGIEPVRLLKVSGDLGDNAAGMLGRGFMVHPLVTNAGSVTFAQPVDPLIQNFFRQQLVSIDCDAAPGDTSALVVEPIFDPDDFDALCNLWAWGVLAPTPEAMDGEKIGDFRIVLGFQGGGFANINFNWEQVPNENSTVSLDPSRTDPIFGQPVALVDWNLLEEDKRTIRKGMDLLEGYFAARGSSSFNRIDLSGGPEQWPPGALTTGDHHMGALRMSKQPSDGIVDPNCKVHTVDNLYVAGSGVFPTSGYANPTLTIAALALRLADHLKALS